MLDELQSLWGAIGQGQIGVVATLFVYAIQSVQGGASQAEVLEAIRQCLDEVRTSRKAQARFMEWCREQSASELRRCFGQHHAELMEYLERLAPDLEVAFNTVLGEMAKDHSEVMAKLEGLSLPFMAVTAETIIQLPQKSGKVARPDSPSYLLDPKSEVVPFFGRTEELADVIDHWCASDLALAVRLYSGSGGMGKTRLFRQVCRDLQPRGWLAGFLAKDIMDFSRAEVRFVLTSPVPLFIVVDYPQENADQVLRLLQELLRAGDGLGKVRVVLLVREPGDWWNDLLRAGDGVGEFLSDLALTEKPIQLGPLAGDGEPAKRRRVFESAMDAFASRLDIRDPPREVAVDLSGPHFARALLLHMAAYAAVRGTPLAEEAELLGYVAHREQTRIREEVADRGLGAMVYAPAACQVAAAVTLLGGASRERTMAVAAGISVFAGDANAAARQTVGDILRSLFPPAPDSGQFVAPIEPDLLAESFLGLLDRQRLGEVLDAVVAVGERAQFAKALTHVNRVCRRRPEYASVLQALLERHLGALASAALEVAKAEPDPIAEVLTRVAERMPSDPALAALESDLPEQSVALQRLAVLVTEAALGGLAPGDGMADRAGLLSNWANRLSEVGRRDEALAPAEEAVRIYRELAGQNADAYRPDLAMSLNNWAILLSEVGRRDEALAPAEAAVQIRRELARQNPDAYRPGLAMSLNNWATLLSAVGRRDEALAPAEEAVRIYRELAGQNPDAYRPDLASALNTWANRLSAVGRRDEALAPAEEVVQIRRELAGQNPDAYRPDLASALNNWANRLSEVGRRDEALAPAEGAVQIYRELAGQNPDAYRPDLAMSLNNWANRLSAVGRRDGALAPAEEAMQIYRELAGQNPDAYRPDLAMSLNSWANRLSAVGRRDEALAPAEEALQIRRELAGQNPDAYRPDLATSLGARGSILRESGRAEEALASFEEGAVLLCPLFERLPDAFVGLQTALLRGAAATAKTARRGPRQEVLEVMRKVAAWIAATQAEPGQDTRRDE